jgi:transcriptional regulator GlxA family with amidase domain
MRISILVGPGATDSGLSIALDVLRAANAIHQRSARSAARRPPFEVSVVSSDGRPVTLASGLRVGGLVAARHAARADVWMVPGTWAETEADVERWLRGPGVRSPGARGGARGGARRTALRLLHGRVRRGVYRRPR